MRGRIASLGVFAVVMSVLFVVVAPMAGAREPHNQFPPAAAPVVGQDSVAIEAEMGLGGFLTTSGSNPVRVSVSADVLTVGSLAVTMSGSTLSTPVEIPAGTTKDYVLEFPAINRGGNATIAVRDQRGESVASVRVTARVPLDEAIAAVIGAPDLVAAVDGLATVPFPVDVVGIPADYGDLDAALAIADFLVVEMPPGDADTAAQMAAWVERGGKLVTTPEIAAQVGVAAVQGSVRLGAGVVEVADLTPSAASELRLSSVPPASLFSQGFNDQQLESTLFEAASFGSSAADLQFGWLVVGLVAYVAAVGPLNFFVLSRVGRREWAWATIPLLSIVGMAMFWMVGRADADDARVRHATVVLQQGTVVTGETGLMLSGGTAGEHSLALDVDATITPFDVTGWFGGPGGRTDTELRVDESGHTELVFELASVGIGAARASWRPAAVGVRVDGDTVHNQSGFDFDRWGVRTGDGFVVGDEPLTAGTTVALGRVNANVPREMFGGSPIAEAVSNRGFVEFNESDQYLWPLSWAASQIDPGLLNDSRYFFGFTDGLDVAVTVDGTPRAAAGRSLLVVAGERAPEDAGNATAELISAPGAEHIEVYGPTFVYGAPTVGVRFSNVPAAVDLTLTNDAGPRIGGDLVLYNWATGEFDAVEVGTAFVGDKYVSAAGEVMAEIRSAEFEEVLVDALRLEWSET